MDPEPPQPAILLALSLLPAIAGAAYSVLGATVASLSHSRVAALRDNLNGSKRSAVDRFLSAHEKLRTRWMVFRIAGVTASAAMLGASLGAEHQYGALLAWGIAATAYALPSELVRHYTGHHAEELLPNLLRVARPGEWLVAPLADPLYWLGSRFTPQGEPREPSATLTETEVELLVNEGELNGSLAHDQSEMIRNVLDFGEVTAEEVMVPRIQVDGLDSSLTMAEAMAEVTKSQHSRYPVYADSVDNVAGILHVKDLFHATSEGSWEKTRLLDLARQPVAFVPEGQLASTVLRDMRAGRHHMAIVLDEFGGVAGVLTLEDLLEEIVGDIQDEHDRDEATRVQMLSPHTALVDASTPVADINRLIGTELPEGDYVSLGGLLIEQIGKMPIKGSVHQVLGLKIVIRDADARHIALVELSEVPGVPRSSTTRPPSSAA